MAELIWLLILTISTVPLRRLLRQIVGLGLLRLWRWPRHRRRVGVGFFAADAGSNRRSLNCHAEALSLRMEILVLKTPSTEAETLS